MSLLFEWDPRKASSNFIKHGVSFNEATTVFKDELSITIHDPAHSDMEDRFVEIGNSCQNRILIVIYTERGDKIRIISARQATRKEKRHYEENA